MPLFTPGYALHALRCRRLVTPAIIADAACLLIFAIITLRHYYATPFSRHMPAIIIRLIRLFHTLSPLSASYATPLPALHRYFRHLRHVILAHLARKTYASVISAITSAA